MKHITATVSVGAALAGTSVATQFEDYRDNRYEEIDSFLGWDFARKMICSVLGLYAPPVLVACSVAEGGVLVIELLSFVPLAQALAAMEATQDREVTYHAGSLDRGRYRFYVGLHARTSGAVLAYSHAAAYGQIAKIEVTQTIPQEAVHFPDPNLEAAIREAIGKPTGDIYPMDPEGLAELRAEHRDITDLTGLEYCVDLTHLYLLHNEISELSPLSNLISLRVLWLDENQISDVYALANLTGLTDLQIGLNEIIDISPLANLINLAGLGLCCNQISDISALSNLTSLTSLSLWINKVSDISALAGLTKLSYLSLGDNQISDISLLEGLTNLSELWLDDNNISDIKPLVDNTGLGEGDEVWLFNNPLSQQSINEYIPALEGRGVTVEYWGS